MEEKGERCTVGAVGSELGGAMMKRETKRNWRSTQG